ncbi:MAG: hypothetical protein F9K29_07540 [Hyphomicrobiaceae bacterium]|nr:MAG: hypothetical protein F9K29_07540 [Hyphomicrobiaceae bacterium]
MRALSWSMLASILAFALVGCASIGPVTIPRDRVDYSGAMAESWKEQTLLNIVKLRYLDTPMYVDVSSVVASHELLTEVDTTVRIVPTPVSSAQSYGNLEARGRYTDRPTISYVPLAGERFINGLLRPLPPQTLFALMEAGHPADFVLQMAARAINDISNVSRSVPRAQAGSPEFAEVVAALRRIQRAGAISLRTEIRGKRQVAFVSIRSLAGGAAEADVRYVKQLLRLNPPKQEYLLVSGSYRRNANELALLTRSIQEIMVELAVGVDVPSQDLLDGRATRIPQPAPGDVHRVPPLRIRSGAERPSDAFAAVRYGNSWFWVDDRDLNSKRVFMFLRMFSSLAETGVVPQAAIVTIPAR